MNWLIVYLNTHPTMTTKNKYILLLTIFLFTTLSINAASETYRLKATSAKAAECYHPRNGFVFKHTPQSIPFNKDSFSIDFRRGTFKWTDSKGTSSNKIYDVQKIPSGYTFKTEHHYVRLIKTTKNIAILGMIISVNNGWHYLEFKCNIH